MDLKLKKEISFLKKKLSGDLESIVLFGSYARGDENESSDIDILLILNKKIDEIRLESQIREINPKIQFLILTTEEFRERVISFNHQLITLFYDGYVFYDKNRFYYKMENLFLALNRKRDFKLRFRNKIITIKKLLIKKNFI